MIAITFRRRKNTRSERCFDKRLPQGSSKVLKQSTLLLGRQSFLKATHIRIKCKNIIYKHISKIFFRMFSHQSRWSNEQHCLTCFLHPLDFSSEVAEPGLDIIGLTNIRPPSQETVLDSSLLFYFGPRAPFLPHASIHGRWSESPRWSGSSKWSGSPRWSGSDKWSESPKWSGSHEWSGSS